MKNYGLFYYFYNSFFVKSFRLVIFLVLLVSFLNSFYIVPQTYLNFKYPLFLLSLFIMFEVFFRFKISKQNPFLTIKNNLKQEPLESFTLKSLDLYLFSFDIDKISKNKSVKFMMEKCEIKKEEIEKISLNKGEIAKAAFNLAIRMHAQYVVPIDIFAAYLLLSESQTKLLFSKKIKEEDVLNILYWTRKVYPNEEIFKNLKVNFWGEGMAESWVYGWTIETKKYAIDLTDTLMNKQVTMFDRSNEYQRLVEALSANKSVLLIGEPGSGKKSLISKFLSESFSENLKGNLYHQRIFQLMIDAFLAGAQNQGELEQRLDSVIAELAHSGNIVIYIQDFENILGASSFKIDLSAALIPYIEKGFVRFIATTSHGSYKKFIESRHELLRSFETIELMEPDALNSRLMLFNSSILIEKELAVSLSYRAVLSSQENADKYSRNEILPGSAITLLRDTASAARIKGKNVVDEQDVIDQISRKANVPVGEPTKVEKELLLNLENELHKRVIGQNEAVNAVAEAMRRLRSGLSKKDKPVSFLFLGPTGVGKTETAKALSEIYYGGEGNMIRLDMSEYASEDGARRLLGSMPGEDGQPGELTDKIYDNPYSLLLLDEFEKANPKILDLFLQVFDDGRLTDNKGKTVSFENSIIIATSNAGSEFIREQVKKKQLDRGKLLEELQSKGIFKPELLNRFDGVVIFKPLEETEVKEVVKLLLIRLQKKMLEKDITITFGEDVVDEISKQGFDEQFGARPLQRFIQDNVEDILARKILAEEVKRGQKISISFQNGLVLQTS